MLKLNKLQRIWKLRGSFTLLVKSGMWYFKAMIVLYDQREGNDMRWSLFLKICSRDFFVAQVKWNCLLFFLSLFSSGIGAEWKFIAFAVLDTANEVNTEYLCKETDNSSSLEGIFGMKAGFSNYQRFSSMQLWQIRQCLRTPDPQGNVTFRRACGWCGGWNGSNWFDSQAGYSVAGSGMERVWILNQVGFEVSLRVQPVLRLSVDIIESMFQPHQG